jgi:hypothetical protein
MEDTTFWPFSWSGLASSEDAIETNDASTSSPAAVSGRRTYVNMGLQIIQAVLCFLVIVGNGTIVIILPKMTKISGETKMCLIQMGLADLGLGLTMMLRIVATFTVGLESSRLLCMSLMSTLTTCGGAAHSSILLFAGHTCWTIKNIANGNKTNKTRLLAGSITAIWIFWMVVCGAPILFPAGEKTLPFCHIGNGYYGLVFLRLYNMLFYLNVFALVIVQGLSLYWLRQYKNNLNDVSTVSQLQKKGRINRKRNIIIIILMILFVYLISVAPYQITQSIIVFCPNNCGFKWSFLLPFTTLSPLKSIVTIFIYMVRIAEFRDLMLTPFRCRSNRAVFPAATP